MSSSVDVLIIGAGVSGLYAGQLLNEVDNLSVLIVEAGQIIGGRVRQNQGFVPWKIDLGGEFIHGENTFVKKLSDSKGWKTIPSFNPETEYAYLGRERKSFLFLNDKDVEYMMDFVEKSGIEPPKIDCTLLDHVVKNKVPFRVLGLIDTSYAKTWSTDIDKIGMREYIREMEKEFDLDNGEDNFRLEESYAQLIEYMSTNLKIKLNWQAKKVIYSKEEGKVHVVNQHGEQIAAKKVILTIPITVLQSADIEFVPPLPAEKVQAIQSLQMDSALKVILKFRAKFWGDNNRVFCCADCFIPQIWFDGPPERNLPKDKEVWICVGFIGGDLAANISTMAKEKAVVSTQSTGKKNKKSDNHTHKKSTLKIDRVPHRTLYMSTTNHQRTRTKNYLKVEKLANRKFTNVLQLSKSLSWRDFAMKLLSVRNYKPSFLFLSQDPSHVQNTKATHKNKTTTPHLNLLFNTPFSTSHSLPLIELTKACIKFF
eukprot:TRINITY_DN4234_c0_g1_i6.p1 TRINITY_DN4234_c0_g1~~TRINITY_DN4234_c0_g1_i6.p1  ORF type:complete len:482 (-),score=88.15 TRINITY_DN4234_c0_g1_i6:1043-2488(-)